MLGWKGTSIRLLLAVIDRHSGSIRLHKKLREPFPEMPRESICLNDYDESPSVWPVHMVQPACGVYRSFHIYTSSSTECRHVGLSLYNVQCKLLYHKYTCLVLLLICCTVVNVRNASVV